MHLGTFNQQLSLKQTDLIDNLINAIDTTVSPTKARRQDVTDFIDICRPLIAGPRATKLGRALDVLAGFPTQSTVFSGISIPHAVVGMAVRILKPETMRQGPYGLCGPATFATLLAKNQPEAYCVLGDSLLRHGHATVGSLRIEPNEHVRGHSPQPPVEACDWLITASLRNEPTAFSEDLELGKYGGTRPDEMYKWLKSAGYPTICQVPTRKILGSGIISKLAWDGLLLDWHPSKPSFLSTLSKSDMVDPVGNLWLADRFCRNGWHVMLMITEKLASTSGTRDPIESAVEGTREMYRVTDTPVDEEAIATARQSAINALTGSAGPNHWVLAKTINRSPRKITIERYSYGKLKLTVPIAHEIFYGIYGGFVAVTDMPPDTARARWSPSD